MDNDFTVEETQHTKGAKIKIIGCGGGGGNMVNRMCQMGLGNSYNLDLISANTDKQALGKSLAKTKLVLGEKKTRGLGAGGDPVIGTESAKENYEEIKAVLEDSDIVFISSGLGGGTGTGAAPIVAQAAKEVGALTVGVVTMPFVFEGKKRKKIAEAGLHEFKKEVDSILVIQNQKVLNFIDKNASSEEAYGAVDDVLTKAVKGMVSLLLGNGDVNVDFADVKAIMSHRGLALMGVGYAKGQNAAMEALNIALESPLLDGLNVKNAKGIILHFKHNPKFPFMQVADTAQSIEESSADENITFKYGYTKDESMEEDEIEVTIIATGFEEKEVSVKEIAKENNKKNIYINMKTGSYSDEAVMSVLETPTYMRNQMD